MQRRDFLGLLSGAAACPITAWAQQPAPMKRIGLLMGIAESDPEGSARVAAFRQGLQSLKWVEGANIKIDLRWATDDAVRTKAYAAELVSLAPDAIFA